jgi:hypothetical protein
LNGLLYRLALWVLIAIGLSGCVSVRSYVDPSFAKAGYQDIQRPASPAHWHITVEFQREGSPYPKADSSLLQQVDQVVRGSGIAVPDDSVTDATLHVVVNNFGDQSAAAAKGFGTGLTFGLVGSLVTDFYEMSFTFTKDGQTVSKSGYRGALSTTIGNASGPPGLQPLDPPTAFDKVIEEMMLNALADIQSATKGSAGGPKSS